MHSKIGRALGITGSAKMERGSAYRIRKVANRVGRGSQGLVHRVTGSISKGDRGSGRRDSNSKVQRKNKSIRLLNKTVEECVSSEVGGKEGDHQIVVRNKMGNGTGRIRSRVAHIMVARIWVRRCPCSP